MLCRQARRAGTAARGILWTGVREAAVMTAQYARIDRTWHAIAPRAKNRIPRTECGVWVLPEDEHGDMPVGDRCTRCVP